MAGNYKIGNAVRLSSTFIDAQNEFADPTTVTLKVSSPSDVVISFSNLDIIKDDVGRYHYDFTPDSAGLWKYRWEGTGAVIAADDGRFTVIAAAFS